MVGCLAMRAKTVADLREFLVFAIEQILLINIYASSNLSWPQQERVHEPIWRLGTKAASSMHAQNERCENDSDAQNGHVE